MKNIFYKFSFIAVIAILGTNSLSAQRSGVFMTYADYINLKMEYGIDCATEKHTIRLNDFLGKDYVTVVHDGKPYKLKKNEIWGFQLCEDKIVRFQNKEDFPLVDKGILWIYSKQSTSNENPKTHSFKTVTTYFFSKGGDGAIRKLTLVNLKAAFPDNHQLHDALDKQFDSDASLEEFDQFHKKYKINHFLESQKID